jgi:hypothetical protein
MEQGFQIVQSCQVQQLSLYYITTLIKIIQFPLAQTKIDFLCLDYSIIRLIRVVHQTDR